MSSNQQQAGKKKIGLNSVISWGASVVIIGLMFKILHLTGGEYMIAIGLCTEAFLFLILGFAAMSADEDEVAPAPRAAAASGKIDELLATSITPKVIERLTSGFENFTKTVDSVNQIAGSFNVTQALIKEMETTTNDVKKFRDNIASVSSGMGQFNSALVAIGQMSAVSTGMIKDLQAADEGIKMFSKNMGEMNKSFGQFSQTLVAINQMTQSSATMLKEFEAATVGMRAYNKNLADLSKVYQAQLDAFKR
jgi:gliding motility-associated protein GldL